MEKTIEIRIVDDNKAYLEERKRALRDLEEGKKVNIKAKKTIAFTPKIFAKVFSPERIRIIRTLQKNKVDSISHLAKILGRSFEAVDRDIKYLEGMNILALMQKEKAKIPIIPKELKLTI